MILEFFTLKNAVHGKVVTWRLRMEKNGPIVARSTEEWLRLGHAKTQTGLMLRELLKNEFEVVDLTRLSAAKIPAGPRKTRPRSSRAVS
jgi:hypothetical protein